MTISVLHANKRYGDFAALDDVSIDIPSGSLTPFARSQRFGKVDVAPLDRGPGPARFGQHHHRGAGRHLDATAETRHRFRVPALCTVRLRPRPVRTRIAVVSFDSLTSAADGSPRSSVAERNRACWRSPTGAHWPRSIGRREPIAPRAVRRCWWCRRPGTAPTRKWRSSPQRCPPPPDGSPTPATATRTTIHGCDTTAWNRKPTDGRSARTSRCHDPHCPRCSRLQNMSGNATAWMVRRWPIPETASCTCHGPFPSTRSTGTPDHRRCSRRSMKFTQGHPSWAAPPVMCAVPGY